MTDSTRALTSRDLARLAGVSQSTVSRVLTGHPRVSADTRARVLSVLEQAGYTPNAVARAMKTGRTGTIGVFMSRVTSPFHATMLDLIGRKLRELDLAMMLWNVEHDPHGAGIAMVKQRLVDGVLFTSANHDSPVHQTVLRSGVPTVLLHRGIDGLECDQVLGDNFEGARALGRYLVRAGHRRVGLVTSPFPASTGGERDAGFRTAMAEAGIELPDACVVEGSFEHADGHRAARRLLSLPEPPTAIFAITDMLGFGVLDGARHIGVRVPEDLWVAGFDNTALAAWEAFDLTTVDQPIESIVSAGVERLRHRIENPALEPAIKRFPCQVVVRGTTAHHPLSNAVPDEVRDRHTR